MVDSATDGEWQTLEQGMPVGDQEIQCDIVTDPEYYCYHNLAEIQHEDLLAVRMRHFNPTPKGPLPRASQPLTFPKSVSPHISGSDSHGMPALLYHDQNNL